MQDEYNTRDPLLHTQADDYYHGVFSLACMFIFVLTIQFIIGWSIERGFQ